MFTAEKHQTKSCYNVYVRGCVGVCAEWDAILLEYRVDEFKGYKALTEKLLFAEPIIVPQHFLSKLRERHGAIVLLSFNPTNRHFGVFLSGTSGQKE